MGEREKFSGRAGSAPSRGVRRSAAGARRWSRRCETLELEIVDYLRQCLGVESGPVEFSLLVE